jgi:hypothetical protein
MSKQEWLVYTDGQPNAYAFTRGAKTAARRAMEISADYRVRVIVTHHGKQAGIYTGALWVQVTDQRLNNAIEAMG